jgi:hypothetical protein
MPASVPVIDLRLRPPVGRPNDFAPVVSAQFLKERLDAITIG